VLAPTFDICSVDALAALEALMALESEAVDFDPRSDADLRLCSRLQRITSSGLAMGARVEDMTVHACLSSRGRLRGTSSRVVIDPRVFMQIPDGKP
jgi:hypothetical protein